MIRKKEKAGKRIFFLVNTININKKMIKKDLNTVYLIFLITLKESKIVNSMEKATLF